MHLNRQQYSGIVVKEITKTDYDLLSQSYDIYPFLESAWVESFKCENIDPIYFEFSRSSSSRVGIACGIVVKSKLSLLKSASKILYLFGMPGVRGASNLEVITSLRSHLAKMGFNTVTIAGYFKQDNQCLTACGFDVKDREEYILDLSESREHLWEHLHRGRKRSVNKGIRLGMTFRLSSDIEAYKKLKACVLSTKDRRAKRGFGRYNHLYVPFMSEEVLLKQLSSKLASIGLVQYQNAVISGILVIKNARYCYALLAGSTQEGYELDAPSFSLWNLIVVAHAAGCKQLNLGALPNDESACRLAQYKHSYGARNVACGGGSAYLQGYLRKSVHQVYKLVSRPDTFIEKPLAFVRKAMLDAKEM